MQRALATTFLTLTLGFGSTPACFGPGSGGGGGVPTPCVANPSLPQCAEGVGADTTVSVDGANDSSTPNDGVADTSGPEVSPPDGGPTDTSRGCPVGTTRCNGKVVESCNGIAWAEVVTCGDDEACVDAVCVPSVCEPDCVGKACGPDGCGGNCGTCDSGTCNAGVCECVSDCGGKECGLDSCGNSCGTCQGDETCSSAGMCESPVCTPTCGECGPDGCGGTCGNCPSGWNCEAGSCVEVVCTPDCNGKDCGGDGCGGTCGTCGADETCNAGVCAPSGGGCGGATFEGCCSGNGSTVQWCENDALQSNTCEDGAVCAWSSTNGYFTCSLNPEEPPAQFPYTCGGETCTETCGAVQCGYACGQSCGGCAAGTNCDITTNTCEACACEPAQECGVDACGNSCGTCATDELCNAGTCIPDPCAAGVGVVGCCDGNLSLWCQDGQPQGTTCEDSCGWNADQGYYDCGQTGADPSGAAPIDCN